MFVIKPLLVIMGETNISADLGGRRKIKKKNLED